MDEVVIVRGCLLGREGWQDAIERRGKKTKGRTDIL